MSSFYRIINKTKAEPISRKAKIADSFFLRFKGLMFKKAISEEEALIFYNAPSIHTFFMRFPIDLAFLDKKMQVIRIYESLSPWKAVFCPKSFSVIEFPPHRTSQKSLEIGDILDFEPIDPSKYL